MQAKVTILWEDETMTEFDSESVEMNVDNQQGNNAEVIGMMCTNNENFSNVNDEDDEDYQEIEEE